MFATVEEITAYDGKPLAVYYRHEPGRPTVLLFNAVGISHRIFDTLTAELAQRYSVLTWETRALPSRAGADFVDAATFEGQRHLEDAQAVLDWCGVPVAHVVGWCSGANVAIDFHLWQPDRVASLVLLNGAYGFTEPALISQYESQLEQMFRQYLSNPHIEHFIHRTLSSMISESTADLPATETDLKDMLMAPFASTDSLRDYARLCLGVKAARKTDIFGRITVPAFYVAGTRDEIQPHSATERAHELTAHSALDVRPGDHYMVFTDAGLAEAVTTFVTNVDIGVGMVGGTDG
jgi:pimeloyl-ACP methyl ester carboxylesterase